MKKNKKKEAKGLGVRKQEGKYISRLLFFPDSVPHPLF